MASIHVVCYDGEEILEKDIAEPSELAGLSERWEVVWVDVHGLGDADRLAAIGDVFGLHRLALEDVLNIGQRTKIDPYDEHLFVVMHISAGIGGTEQVSLFLGDRFVISVQERPGDCFDGVRERIRNARPRIRSSGADYLAYALMDAVVDAYYPALEKVNQELESLEEEVFSENDQSTLSRLQKVKAELREIRQVTWPHREALFALLKGESKFIKEHTYIYLRDCADHATQIAEMVEMSRELATDLMNAHLSNLSHRLNEVMKILTIMAAIFIPLSFIAGVYGMNFDPSASPLNMPELDWYWGYPGALTLMAVVAAGLILYFKRKRWL